MQFIRNHIAPADSGHPKESRFAPSRRIISVFALGEGFDKNHDRRLGFN